MITTSTPLKNNLTTSKNKKNPTNPTNPIPKKDF
jgi:hypothetical protein